MTVSEVLKRDNNNLDLVRILVATIVIWHHSFSVNFGNGSSEPIFRFLKVTDAGSLGVNVFFFVSGLLVTNSLLKKQSVSKFLISRFFRIFPALLFLLLVTTIVIGPIVSSFTLTEYFSDGQTLRYFIDNLMLKVEFQLPGFFHSNVLPDVVNGSLWTLPLEVGCYIFLLTVFLLINGHKKVANTFLFVIIFLAAIPIQLLLDFFQRQYIMGLIPVACFALGALFAINQEKVKLDFNLMLGLSLLLFIFWRYTNIVHLLFPMVISVFMLFLSTDKLFLKLKPKHDISFGLYIWHFLVLQLLIYYFGQMNVYVLFVLSLFITAFISLFSFVFIEEKAMNLGYRLGNKASNSKFNLERIGVYALILVIVVMLAKLH